MNDRFDFGEAFSRTVGWVTRTEQTLLRGKRIAIAGLGGVGGHHLLTLSRLGIGAFHIADFDRFELANFNRQVGATMSHLERPKTEVMADMARDINPEIKIQRFDSGIDAGNLDRFLDGVDLFVDGLDAFALAPRRAAFAACAKRRIPALGAGPLGMSSVLMSFMPGKMSFEEYFQLDGLPEEEQILRYLVGVAPAALQRTYLADPSTIDLAGRRGPSTPMACDLCAGMVGSEVLKILLGRGKVYSAPHGFQFDAYRNKLVHTWRPGGNRNPLNRLALRLARKYLTRKRSIDARDLLPVH